MPTQQVLTLNDLIDIMTNRTAVCPPAQRKFSGPPNSGHQLFLDSDTWPGRLLLSFSDTAYASIGPFDAASYSDGQTVATVQLSLAMAPTSDQPTRLAWDTNCPPVNSTYGSSHYPVLLVSWTRGYPLAYTPALPGERVPSLIFWEALFLLFRFCSSGYGFMPETGNYLESPADRKARGLKGAGSIDGALSIYGRNCTRFGHLIIADYVILYEVKNTRLMTKYGTLRSCKCTKYRCRRGHGKRNSQANRS